MKMKKITYSLVLLPLVSQYGCQDLPEGYHAFEESPKRIPPKVQKPPYIQTETLCPGIGESNIGGTVLSLNNLCGDLSIGFLPENPIVPGLPYPFEVIKNATLTYFSKTLPILKEDSSLPKVAKGKSKRRSRNKKFEVDNEQARKSETKARGFCQNSYGLFCLFFQFWQATKRRSSSLKSFDFMENDEKMTAESRMDKEEPMTPCPSSSQYVTPVFAKNYQGVWRYVVQIPYEGYFTQTTEVIKCISQRCHYLDGTCLASPRWVSLLVAELYYPLSSFNSVADVVADTKKDRVKQMKPPFDVSNTFREDRRKRNTSQCDGVDEIGCYQVRMYYDWFLVPGSCKCWKQEFFTKYGR
ncbi:uncharacterized protein LOC136032860 isoform X2 [Artemia franciscana]|uniref:uncharacterized protein LOC136032860 isoform X2 n=1 Tax=Artemia franciscana TaxID=6661 RepID=UPI0032DBDC00